MQFPVKNYIEFCMSQALLDRAGRITTKDIEENCSFAPYRRALRKINFEENFHVGHGARWVKFYWNYSDETRQAVQDAADWLFPHGTRSEERRVGEGGGSTVNSGGWADY